MCNNDICLVSTNQIEFESASKNRINSFVKHLIKSGHNVKLISMDREEYVLIDDANFEHIKLPIINTKIPNFVKRAALEAKIAKLAIIEANSLNCSSYILTIPSMFLLFFCYILNKKSKKVLDIRDLSWEYLSDSSVYHRVAKYIFKRLALLNIVKFDLVSITNEYEYEYIRKNIPFLSTDKIVKVPNGVSDDIYKKLIKVNKRKNSHPITVSYIGNIGLAQDMSTLINVSNEMPHLVFNIVGSGTDFERVKSLINPNNSNLNLCGRMEFDDLIEIYDNSDILYAQLTPEFSSAMPSKLYEYLATGKYIIYGGNGIAIKTLQNFGNISLIEPCNVDVLKNEIDRVIEKKAYMTISESNRKLIESHFLRDKTVKNLLEML